MCLYLLLVNKSNAISKDPCSIRIGLSSNTLINQCKMFSDDKELHEARSEILEDGITSEVDVELKPEHNISDLECIAKSAGYIDVKSIQLNVTRITVCKYII